VPGAKSDAAPALADGLMAVTGTNGKVYVYTFAQT
jgi:hypothetical protein